MDLIYTDSKKKDIGVLNSYDVDMAYGDDENDFCCTIERKSHCCEEGSFIYAEDTEYGGIVDDIKVDAENDEVSYVGRSWHGILEKKIFCPEEGQDYSVYDGEANEVLQQVIEELNLSGLFEASEEDSGIEIIAYQMDRYIGGYTGIRKMLKDADAKLRARWKNGKVILSAEYRIDYSQDEEFDTSQVDFTVTKKCKILNHIVCLGKGDLKEQAVIHLFTDQNGGVQPYAIKDPPLEDADYILDESQKILSDENEISEVLELPTSGVTTNYILLEEEPGDWADNCEIYHSRNEERYQKVSKKRTDVYTRQRIMPYDWTVNFTEYYQEDETEGYVKVKGVEDYIILAAKPSDWENSCTKYYRLENNEYVKVEKIKTEGYLRQNKKPSDWQKNFGEYYYLYTDGVTEEYKKVSGNTKNSYKVQTQKPTDWEKSYTSYYKKKKKGGYERISEAKTKKAPTWKRKTYYTRMSGQVAPAWKKGKYYTLEKKAFAPLWNLEQYYEKENNAAPLWGNMYFTKTTEELAPDWQTETYYRAVTDRYAELVKSALERFEEAYASDELEISLEETGQVYDIGDLVGSRDEITDITSVHEVVKKIVKITNDDVSIRYEVR